MADTELIELKKLLNKSISNIRIQRIFTYYCLEMKHHLIMEIIKMTTKRTINCNREIDINKRIYSVIIYDEFNEYPQCAIIGLLRRVKRILTDYGLDTIATRTEYDHIISKYKPSLFSRKKSLDKIDKTISYLECCGGKTIKMKLIL